MRTRASLAILALPALAATLAACGSGGSTPAAGRAAPAAPERASLVIHHEYVGCHDWALNGGAAKVDQRVALTPGSTLTVRDRDVMSHTLVQTGGPKVAVEDPLTDQTNVATVTFTQPGTYRFTTRAGEDYSAGVATKGADNVLRLTVAVS